MCLVCIEWQKGNLTNDEALRNIGEMVGTTNQKSEERRHYFELAEKIKDAQYDEDNNGNGD